MEVSKHVYFIRHAESDANVNNTFSPPDTPLSEKGKQQATHVLSQCQKLPVEVLLASDYTRALETANILNEEIGTELVKSKLLREFKSPSEIIGKPKDAAEVLEIFKEIQKHVKNPNWHYSDEENFHDFRNRLNEALSFIADRKEEHILVVTHSSWLKMLLSVILHDEDLAPNLFETVHEHLVAINTGVTYVRYYGDYDWWQLVTWNNFSHLSEVA